MIDVQLIYNLIAAIIAVVTAVEAIYQALKGKQIVSFYTEPMAEIKPALVEQMPARSWVMSDATRRWVKTGEAESDYKRIDEQIAAAESANLRTYYIDTSKGWYLIEYGLIKESGAVDAPKPTG